MTLTPEEWSALWLSVRVSLVSVLIMLVPGIAIGWNPSRAGRYIVRTVDDRGRADSRELFVELVR